MPQFTLVSQGDSTVVMIPNALLESIGLRVGDVIDVTVEDRQLILRSADDTLRREVFETIAQDVFKRRNDAYQRLA